MRKGRDFAIKYTIYTKNKQIIPVCQKVFLNTLGITKHRVQNVIRNFFANGRLPSTIVKYCNLGFGSPRTDMCSKCIEFQEKIKTEKDVSKTNQLIIEQRVHKLKSQAFFKLLREKKDQMATFSFDCQKNLVLPKVPDQSC